MARSSNDPLQASDILEYLEGQDDFSLELRTVRCAHELGFDVTHGGTYTDPATNKPRQYDVRAGIAKGRAQVQLTIECKSLEKSCPLVVSRVPRTKVESFHECVCGVPDKVPALEVRRVKNSALYPISKKVGKSTVQPRRTDKGWSAQDAPTYEKWSQALASADELIGRAEQAMEPLTKVLKKAFFLPVLVVSNGTLWSVDYDANGEILFGPQLQDEVELFVGKKYGSGAKRYVVSHLHVCTEVGLKALLERIADDDYWLGLVFDD